MPTVDEKLQQYRGAPRLAYLRKWEKWLRELFGEKYRDAVGEGLDAVERFLLEHCHGLSDDECYSEVSVIATGKEKTDQDYVYQACLWKDALAKQLREQFNLEISHVQDAMNILEHEENAEIRAICDDYIRNSFICMYQLPYDLKLDAFRPDILVDIMDETGAFQYADYFGYKQVNSFRQVWDFSFMRRYRAIIVRPPSQPRWRKLCEVYADYDNGILWISNCSYLLFNDRKKVFVYYIYKYLR